MYYLLPIETIDNGRGPKYFSWRFSQSGIDTKWSMMDYGFVDSALLFAPVITPADHAVLMLNADVFAFPENLDAPVVDPSIDQFFEDLNLPTDWLTPATTYRELLRQVAGMMQFNQRYGVISGGHSIFESANLDTRLRRMTAEEEAWFMVNWRSFGFDSGAINTNTRLRQLVKQTGDFWADKPIIMGGVEI